MEPERTFTAFAGHRCIASSGIEEAIRRTKECLDGGTTDPVLVFEDQTGAQIDLDLRGTPEDAIERLVSHPLFAHEPHPKPPRPGRPKLGVTSREVSLLPRHWEWLGQQRGGISVALRLLVDEARKRSQSPELARRAREAAGRFMWVMAGNLKDFEEASRALYARDDARLRRLTRAWPKDIRQHVSRLVDNAARLERQVAAEAAV